MGKLPNLARSSQHAHVDHATSPQSSYHFSINQYGSYPCDVMPEVRPALVFRERPEDPNERMMWILLRSGNNHQ